MACLDLVIQRKNNAPSTTATTSSGDVGGVVALLKQITASGLISAVSDLPQCYELNLRRQIIIVN